MRIALIPNHIRQQRDIRGDFMEIGHGQASVKATLKFNNRAGSSRPKALTANTNPIVTRSILRVLADQ